MVSSLFLVGGFCLEMSASQHKEKAEANSNAENIFDRVSNGIVDALKDREDILKMGSVGKIVFTPQTRNAFHDLNCLLSLTHSKTPSFKNELLCIPKYAKKSAMDLSSNYTHFCGTLS
ncbi:hypothetical protein GQ457_10G004750 [Hibiscus cannabinus]